MSNEKRVWTSDLSDFTHVNIYSIGMNIPDIYDFQSLQANTLKHYDDLENKEIAKKNIELGAYGVEISKLIGGFKKFPALPDSLWLENDKEPLPTQSEYIFRIKGGGVVFNEACANILKQFNLGNSTLTPLKIHKIFTDELWFKDTFYLLNLCEQRQFITHPQSSEDYEYVANAYTCYELTDETLEIQLSAQQCDVDLWHDPLLRSSYFLSDALYTALHDAGMHEQWNAHRCKFV